MHLLIQASYHNWLYHSMKGAQIVQVLAGTLSPSLTNVSYSQLSEWRSSHGFAVELLLIADDSNYQIEVRQSALVYLKNMLSDHCQRSAFIHFEDLQTIKCNVLEALIRNVCDNKLTPTIREIVFIMANKQYPKEWPTIIDQISKYIAHSGDLNELAGSIEALKAIYSVFGRSISKQIELSNLCNRTIISLLSLTSKLLQNYSKNTSIILIGIFKIFATAIYFYLPEIIENNIHNWMIFIKKLLDLSVNIQDIDNNHMYILKKLCLRILFRIYQRHANIRVTEKKRFALSFQERYTKSFIETLILQVINEANIDFKKGKKHMELTKLSLSCLAYIYRENSDAVLLINNYWPQILNLCLQRYKISINRNYPSFRQYKLYLQEQRVHLKELLFSFMRNEAQPSQQNGNVQSLLSTLFECIQKGDLQLKQLCLYLFSEMSTQIQCLAEPLDQTMVTFIVQYIKPLLTEQNHVIIRTRACNLIASYSYLEFPLDHLQSMAQGVYNCLLVSGKDERELFLKVYACNAFNSLLKYDPIVQFIKPFLKNILQIYTSLLEADISIIKNFEDLLNLLEEQLAAYSNDLILILIDMFKNYAKMAKDRQEQGYITYNYQSRDAPEEDEEEDIYDDNEAQSNHQGIAKAYISSIRQVLQITECHLSQSNCNLLFEIVIWVFGDEDQHYIEEGFNILNLILYKNNQQIDQIYHFLFKVIVYAILGLPQDFIGKLRIKGDSFSLKYAQILQNLCIDPDVDIIENSIGCLRNFIVKINQNTLRNSRDEFNISYMEYILRLVKAIHESQSQNVSQTDRSIVLTLYITLIEYNVVKQFELEGIIGNVASWMQMEQIAIEEERKREELKPINLRVRTFKVNQKYIYTPIYLQIVLLTFHFYPQSASKSINFNAILLKIVELADCFKCDYQIARVVIGVSDLLSRQLISDQGICSQFLNCLPDLVKRLCQLRKDGDNPKNDLEMDDQAEEQRYFGDDENSHMIGWQQPKLNVTPHDLQLVRNVSEDEESDNDWEEEFNKFYISPFDRIDELKYLEECLKGPAADYLSCMDIKKQQDLSLYLLNAPPKIIS